ncbi:MAG TPA: pyridoxamine 5'-phosphate oxidase family protein [Dehalococcoidia bacterium]
MDEQALAFLQQHPAASMITLRPAGSPHAVRVAIAVVDGRIQSSGTRTRKRTAYLRRDPRSTLFVFDNEWRWLTLECDVTILDGPDVPQQSVRLFRTMQVNVTPAPPPGKILWYGAPKSEEEFLTIMRDEQRIIYEFNVKRAYGMYGEMPGR